ncbi:hypothetical protein CWIS_08190 [Cellulomonas sp. A375-1]|nr:hypothetical protein CWIS_08190 [Cellulomonas sp. A375-1]
MRASRTSSATRCRGVIGSIGAVRWSTSRPSTTPSDGSTGAASSARTSTCTTSGSGNAPSSARVVSRTNAPPYGFSAVGYHGVTTTSRPSTSAGVSAGRAWTTRPPPGAHDIAAAAGGHSIP